MMKGNFFKHICVVVICYLGILLVPKTVEATDNTMFNYTITEAEYTVNPHDSLPDATGIQSLLDKAIGSEEIITIYFPAGTYYIDKTLVIYSNTHLILHEDAVMYRMDSMINKMLLHNVDQNGKMNLVGGYEMSKNITIEGGTWNGGNTKIATDGTDVIRFDHAENITIQNCTMKNTYDCHIVELVGVKDATITDCTFTGFRYMKGKEKNYVYAREAIQIESAWTSNEKDLNDKDAYWAKGTYVDGTSCKNVVISRNTFINCPCGVGQHRYSKTGKYRNEDVVISNNKFTFTKTMKYCKTAITACGTNNLTIMGNMVDGLYRFGTHVIASSGVIIENNDFKNMTMNGIMIDDGKQITIKNNTIRGTKKHGISVGGGIVTEIMGNSIANVKNIGISVDAGTVKQISNNSIKNPQKHGICVSVKKKGVKAPIITDIIGNTIIASKYNGITIGAGNITNIKNNTITKVKKHGISLCGTSYNKNGGKIKNVSYNVIASPKQNGISVDAGKITNISSNEIKSTGKHGISIVGTSKTSKRIRVTNIVRNSITSPKQNGMSINAGKISMISKNTVKKSKNHGISILGVADVGGGKKKNKGIIGNTVTICKNHGIVISGKAKVSAIVNNKVTGANKVGILMNDKAKVQWVMKNTLKKCKCHDIQNVSPTKTKIEQNKGKVA